MMGSPDNTRSVRLGVASHNLFDIAYARLLSLRMGIADRIGFEMLQGMVPSHAAVVRASNENGLLLYTPIVEEQDYDVAVAYLFRRLEENSTNDNFLRSLFSMSSGNASFKLEASRFHQSCSVKSSLGLSVTPRRRQERPAAGAFVSSSATKTGEYFFLNEPDSDPCIPATRKWALGLLNASILMQPKTQMTLTMSEMKDILSRGKAAQESWEQLGAENRRILLGNVADELARRRGDLIASLIVEGSKVLSEADSEVSEAIDFARYYGDRGVDLGPKFRAMGIIGVVSPWNYPVAIPCGGVMAALAAGNTVILKPAPETPRCAEIVVECALKAGIPPDVLQFVRAPENEIGKHLICEVDGVILTGAAETASLFMSWKPEMRLFAETSGKNSMIVMPTADIDLAVADLVHSSFGHSGQKCSACSLCIVVGDLRRDPRFLRQVKDAVESLAVGPAGHISSAVGPLIAPPNDKLSRALGKLDEGESWLVQPQCIDIEDGGTLWRPGVKLGVQKGSWFQQTECFGPVLGVIEASSLEEAIEIQNSSDFGLTAGMHSLDPEEIALWKAKVEAGNLYVNREITGAIVCRQPFGGWKKSCVGPGAQAGGVNYVMQFGKFEGTAAPPYHSDAVGSEKVAKEWLLTALASDEKAWLEEFSVEKDSAGLFCESNVHRYRALTSIAIRVAADALPVEVQRVAAAVARWGIQNVYWSEADSENEDDFAELVRTKGLKDFSRVRILGTAEKRIVNAAAEVSVRIADDPVSWDGRVELLHYCAEQTISEKMHRFGNLIV